MNAPTSLPVDAILSQLKQAIVGHSAVVLHAPPGAGKTTRVPLALLDIIPQERGRIVMLEPRRIAAVSAARWMAQLLDEVAGETVGYAIRFDAKQSDKTRIDVVTEGILTRRMQTDPALEGTGLVIFDEFHERSMHADLALALCLDIRKGIRPDLKVLIMSATLDTGPVAALLGGAPVVSSSGKSYPVDLRYGSDASERLASRVTSAVQAALRETEGDILVFLPGVAEIRACMKDLNELPFREEQRLAIHGLYGDLPFEEQERAIMPSRDHRKIVLATNIAETSLTIQGVHVVIDSGLTRMLRYDPRTGMNRLVTLPVAKSSAEQRAGRAGRLGPGVCYRLYSLQTFSGKPPFSQPEILVADLSPLALELALWGVKDFRKLSWLDMLPGAAWDAAVGLLKDLGALDEGGAITPAGRQMARIPLHPRLSRLLAKARELRCIPLGADLCALLTERDIFRRQNGTRITYEADIMERIAELARWRGGALPDAAFDRTALRAVERTAKHLIRLLANAADTAASEQQLDQDIIARLLLSAFPDRICKQRQAGSDRFVHAQGRGVRVSADSRLLGSEFIVAAAVDAGELVEGYVHVAAAASEALIRQECAARIRHIRKVEWDRREGRIVATMEERLETLLLSSRPFLPSDEESLPLLFDAIASEPGMLGFSAETKQFQARVNLLASVFPEEEWPDLSDTRLFSDPGTWLRPWTGGVRSAHDLKRINILTVLKSTLTPEQGRAVEVRAPTGIVVPSGNRVAIDYLSGSQPVLAVKLQEMFGLADTPSIAGGRVKLLLHLLSPAGRPVQITQDLKGFWNNAYREVKKDLKGRYPKHPWPDDPWIAMPTRRTKNRS